MTLEVVSTEDGSITCRDARTGELYHNRAGAYTEALHNYVEPCNLERLVLQRKSLRVLDVCFGLGYNTFVLILELLKSLQEQKPAQSFQLDVLAIDRDENILSVLPAVLSDERLEMLAELGDQFGKIEQENISGSQSSFKLWRQIEELVDVDLHLKFVDLRKEVLDLVERKEKFDFVFHDGFSPKSMPELWTQELFQAYAQLLDEQGVLLTYSSATAVRGALKAAGLEVKRTAKVGGKSGGTIAAPAGVIDGNPFAFPLTQEEKARLGSRSAIPYRDPQMCDSPQTIVDRRLAEQLASALPVFKKTRS